VVCCRVGHPHDSLSQAPNKRTPRASVSLLLRAARTHYRETKREPAALMGLLCAAPHPGGCPARWPLSLFGPGHHDVQRGAVQRSARPHRAAGLFAQKNILALHTRLSMSANANEAARMQPAPIASLQSRARCIY